MNHRGRVWQPLVLQLGEEIEEEELAVEEAAQMRAAQGFGTAVWHRSMSGGTAAGAGMDDLLQDSPDHAAAAAAADGAAAAAGQHT